DASGAQLASACGRLNGRDANVRFLEASATATGLPRGLFDLVYCRFLLIHLPEPERALVEMRALLKPGGTLVCEDGDLTSAGSEPPSALDAFADLWGRLGRKWGGGLHAGPPPLPAGPGRRLPRPGGHLQPAGRGARRDQAPAGAVRRRSRAGIRR